MADKLMIPMLDTDPQSAAEAGAPLFPAAVAAAMDYFITY
jgi:hypothetical protein